MKLDRIATIARICHEANRALCTAIGDNSQAPWDEAPEWQRSSAVSGVKGVDEGWITEPTQSHESWMAEKQADGWVYGETKDAERKTHPCIVPFNELPENQRAKDVLFFAIAKAMTVALPD